MELSIKDVLKRPHFQDTKVIAGNKGLNRKIKWVHIVEIETFGHLLNGQELILTTGGDWASDKDKSLHYLQQLLDHNASALCIELSENTESPSQNMLALANQNDFPIILFNKEVKFIDITKDIHEVLLGYQENFWWDLEKLYKSFNQTLVSNGSIGDFLKILHQITNKQVVLIHRIDQCLFFPSPSKSSQQKWIKEIEQDKSHALYYSSPIYFLNEEIAQLYVLEGHKNISLFNQFAVKRCGEFLTQYFWKYRQQLEVQNIKQNEWLLDALDGSLTNELTIKNIRQHMPAIKLNQAIIGVIPDIDDPLSSKTNEGFLTSILMSIRTIFENEGFYLIASKDNNYNCYAILLINQQENDTLHNRLNKSLAKLNKLQIDSIVFENLQWLSFGKAVSDYSQLHLSYRTALSTLNYQKNIGKLSEPFYSNLTIYRLIEQMKDRDELNDIVNDYIGPLLSYDQKKGTELLSTLQIYLKNLGSKNETARELFIVRQTLYHRLDRIKLLIGEDYMDPKKRVMIEFAIYTLGYLENSGFESVSEKLIR